MKHRTSYSIKAIKLLAGLSFLVALASCENFLNGADVRQQLEDAIAYNNAPEHSVLILTEPETGTCNPSGDKTVKHGYPFSVSFSESSEWCFIKWKAVWRDDITQEVPSNLVKIYKPDAKSTEITVNTSRAVRIIPFCEKRIKLQAEPSPRYAQDGVSRDTPIIIEFSLNPDESSFIFDEEEIPGGADVIHDSEGKIWAYKLDDQTFLKNISITDSNGISLGQHFSKPILNENLLMIIPEQQNPLELDNGGNTKLINVLVSGKITDKNGIAMNQDKSWRYQVNNTTKEKAYVTFTASENSGTVTPANGSLYQYSIGEKVDISFEINEGYYFTGWTLKDSKGNDVDSSIIEIEDATSLHTNIIVRKPESGIIIKANSVLYPQVMQCSPQYKLEGVECDSDIVINFNKSISSEYLSLYSEYTGKGTIQITDASNQYEHLESYFAIADISGACVVIKPHYTIQNIVPYSVDLKNIKVTLNIQQIKDSDGNSLNADNSTWIYRINHNMETVDPVVEMALFKPIFEDGEIVSRQPLLNNELVIVNGVVKDDTYLFKNNHVGNHVYFDATAYDEGTGYKKLVIKETLVCTVDKKIVNKDYGTTTFNSAEYGSHFDKRKYDFNADIDGIVQLDFIFEDFAGNQTTKKYFLIKDTTLDSSVMMNSKQCNVNDRIPVNDMVTEVFDFSDCFDTYLDGYSEKYNYTFFWGYDTRYCDEDLISNEDKTVFSFEHDVHYDCFVKIQACDSVGNCKELIRCIPSQPIVVGVSENMAWENSGWYWYSYIYTVDGDYGNLAAYGASEYFQVALWRYKPDENSEFGEFHNNGDEYSVNLLDRKIIGSNGNNFRIAEKKWWDGQEIDSEFRDGIYEVYVINCLAYNEQRSYFGSLSEPYVFYNNYIPSNPIIDNQTPVFPAPDEHISVYVYSPKSSTGIREGSVQLPANFEKTQGFTYGLYSLYGNKYFNYLGFSLPGNSVYQLKLFARSEKTGKIYYSDYTLSADCSGDNIPPVVSPDDNLNYISAPNKIFPFFYDMEVHDGSGGMYYDEQQQAFRIEYYLIKKDEKTRNADNISRSDLYYLQDKKEVAYLNLPKNYYDQYYNGYRTTLDLGDNFLESYYTLVLDLQDKNNNRGLYSFVVSNLIYPVVPKVYNFVLRDNDTYSFYREIDYSTMLHEINFSFLKDGKTWVRDDSTLSWNYPYSSNSNVAEITISYKNHSDYRYDNLKKDCFICFGSITSQYSVEMDCYNSLYTYFLPAYELLTDEQKLQYCKSKSVIQGIGGTYQVFYDSPCFAHTMVFPTNMLEDIEKQIRQAMQINTDLSEDEARKAVWEAKGREIGLRLINNEWVQGNASYSVPVNQIETGYSYVTVFHFADGTSVMSDVKGK